jgi:hypothetical protein
MARRRTRRTCHGLGEASVEDGGADGPSGEAY